MPAVCGGGVKPTVTDGAGFVVAVAGVPGVVTVPGEGPVPPLFSCSPIKTPPTTRAMTSSTPMNMSQSGCPLSVLPRGGSVEGYSGGVYPPADGLFADQFGVRGSAIGVGGSVLDAKTVVGSGLD